jgi:hypothetical protein
MKLKTKLNDYLIDRYWDFRSIRDRLTLRNIYNFFRDRVDAIVFCGLLLIVGIISPRQLRILMIDALKEKK